jgi:Protein of unknown function (DUF1203)
MTELEIVAIDPARLDAIRAAGTDEEGNPFRVIAAEGWEPLRCCLRRAGEGEQIALISYAPFTARSPWREVGPVFVHGEACKGYADNAAVPEQFRYGPRVLRTYHPDGSLDYDNITLVPEGEDIAEVTAELLGRPGVAEVHARAVGPQCFLFAARAGQSFSSGA